MTMLEFLNHLILWGSLTLFVTFIAGLISVILVDYFNVSAVYRDMVCCSVVASTIIASSIWYWS